MKEEKVIQSKEETIGDSISYIEAEAAILAEEKEVKDRIYHLELILGQTEAVDQKQQFYHLLAKAKQEQHDLMKQREVMLSLNDEVTEEAPVQNKKLNLVNLLPGFAIGIAVVALGLLFWQSSQMSSNAKGISQTKAVRTTTGKKASRLSLATVTLPDLSGMTETEAQQTLQAQGLELGEVSRESSQTVEAGRVIATKQGTAAKLSRGTKVDVIVSTGFRGLVLHNYVGQGYDQVLANLVASGVSESSIIKEEVESLDYLPGLVLEQSFAPDSLYDLDKGETITLKVAKEAVTVMMPDLTGYSYDQAVEALGELGISEDRITPVKAEVDGGAMVQGQSVAAHTEVIVSSVEITLHF